MTEEEFINKLRADWPDKSDRWLSALVRRMKWYIDNDGDMTNAPDLPMS